MTEHQPLRLLVADDSRVNQKIVLAMLGRLGHSADAVATGRQAIEALERHAYDVILMDVQMPEMDGLAAAREIVERWPRGVRPTIVGLTAGSSDDDRGQCLTAGMDQYLQKPVSKSQLADAAARWHRVSASPEPLSESP